MDKKEMLDELDCVINTLENADSYHYHNETSAKMYKDQIEFIKLLMEKINEDY